PPRRPIGANAIILQHSPQRPVRCALICLDYTTWPFAYQVDRARSQSACGSGCSVTRCFIHCGCQYIMYRARRLAYGFNEELACLRTNETPTNPTSPTQTRATEPGSGTA